uniref:Uncharacterized protein n=1 Tax=Arundo donax TaxID=35708 RepID=A0A0A9C657_ARUDO
MHRSWASPPPSQVKNRRLIVHIIIIFLQEKLFP